MTAWLIVAAEFLALFLLIKAIDWHAALELRRRQERAARVVAVLERIEREQR